MGRDADAGRTRYGLIVGGVALVGVVTGALVAGLPTDVPSDIRAADVQPAASTTTAPSRPSPTEPSIEASPPSSAVPIPSTSASTSTSTPTTVAAPVPRPVGEVSVVVANGGGANGLAGSIRDALRAQGYVEVSATNAARRFATSIAYFVPGFAAEAAQLAASLGITEVEAAPPGTLTEDGSTADVVIVLGGDRL